MLHSPFFFLFHIYLKFITYINTPKSFCCFLLILVKLLHAFIISFSFQLLNPVASPTACIGDGFGDESGLLSGLGTLGLAPFFPIRPTPLFLSVVLSYSTRASTFNSPRHPSINFLLLNELCLSSARWRCFSTCHDLYVSHPLHCIVSIDQAIKKRKIICLSVFL